MHAINSTLSWLGGRLANYLSKQIHVHGVAPETPQSLLLATMRPGDVLLVEGHSRVGTAIKYLTKSTWSHAALYVGDYLAATGGNPAHCFVEADITEGVRSVGVEEFAGHHTRICRPVGLGEQACRELMDYAIKRIGARYDLRNVIDLARYLFPTPPLPERLRRRALRFGSGDPTRAICSTLIAQAFQSIHYPVLPQLSSQSTPECPGCVAEILRVRHHSLFVPRDFDVSPYFQIVKPVVLGSFNYQALAWAEDGTVARSTP